MADKPDNNFEVSSVNPNKKNTNEIPSYEIGTVRREKSERQTRPASSVGVESVRPRQNEQPRQSRPASSVGVENVRPRQSEQPRQARPASSVGVESVRPRQSEQPRQARPASSVGVESVRPRQNEQPRQARPASSVGVENVRPRQNEQPRQSRPASSVGVESVRPQQSEQPRQSRPASSVGVENVRPRQNEQPRQARPASSVGVENVRPRQNEQPRQSRPAQETGKKRQRVASERISHKEAAEKENERRIKELGALAEYFKPRDNKPRNYFINLCIVTFKMFLVCVLIVGFSGMGFVLGMSKSYLETVPEIDFTQVTGQDQASILYDANGEVIGNYYNMENREWAELSEVPENLQNAVIAIEDVRFRRHMGIDFKRIVGAAISNLGGGSMQGGSTITQQLIKNTMLSFEQTYKRKIQEASLALELEKLYSKDQILEAYLNTIYMGGSCYGMKTAAKDYFGKDLSELTLRECACLAGLIQNPSRYNPRSNYYSRSNPKRTDNRTNLVLYEMCENGFITKEQYEEAKKDTMTVLEESPYASQTSMIYFTDYILDSAVDAIIEDRNLEDNAKNRTAIRKEIRTGGYGIYSTLDSKKQLAAEEALYNYNNYPKMRSSTDNYTVVGTNPDGSVIRLVQPQAAMAVVDFRNGHIIALVGGRQAPTGSLEFNRSYQSTMPVGSSIKPISVYGPAIEKGAGIGTVYYDFQMRIKGWGTEADKGYPANNSRSYNNAPVTMRRAVTASLNVTAAQALMYDVGLDDSFNFLKKLGVNEKHISKTGSGLALGSSGITPLEMAGAYTAIANLGTYIEPIAFTKIVDKDGNVIVDMESKQIKRKVFSESTAWQITDMMRSVALGMPKSNVAGQTVYGKTGTNSDSRGVFFAGFTGWYVGCCWIGSDAYKALTANAGGSTYAAPLFATVMKAIHKGMANRAANDVDPETIGVTQMQYCSISGKKATAACPKTHTEYGNPSTIPDCDLHATVKICTSSGALATPYCPENLIEQKSITMVPSSGILNDMYNNNHSIFVRIAGEAVLNMSKCSVHSSAPEEKPAE